MKVLLFFTSIAPLYCHSQITDTIKCNIDIKEYEAVIKNNIKERSVYTLNNKKAILDLYEKDSVKLLLDYKMDSEYIVTSIPVFKLKDNFDNNHKSNVLHKIDFSNDDPTTQGEEGSGYGILRRFDYGLNGTVGFEGEKAMFSVNYGLGLAKLQSGADNNIDEKNKHRVLSFTVGFRL